MIPMNVTSRKGFTGRTSLKIILKIAEIDLLLQENNCNITVSYMQRTYVFGLIGVSNAGTQKAGAEVSEQTPQPRLGGEYKPPHSQS
jgi:hypothetical protein